MEDLLMKNKKIKQILAWLTILLIAAVIIYMLYCAFTGKNFLGSLYLIFVIPVIIWVIMFFAGAFRNNNDNDKDSSL